MDKSTWPQFPVASVRRPLGNAYVFALGGLAFVFFILIFSGIAWDVSHNFGQPTASDRYLLGAVLPLRSSVMDRLMRFLTMLGEPPIVGLVGFAVVLGFAVRRRYDFLVTLVAGVGGAAGLVWTLKRVLARPRPPAELALIAESGFSIPSGHATAAVALYGFLVYLLARQCKTVMQKIMAVLAGAALIFGIGFSRVYLGVHWPSDVVAGFALGAAWLAAVVLWLELRRR